MTAGGASRTFTIDVTNSGASDADDVEPHRHGRLAAARRLDRGGRLHCCARRASRSPARSATWPPARPKSITVTYHVDTTTDSAAGVEQHGDARPRTRTAPTLGHATRSTIVEDVDLSVTKTFDRATVTAGGASQTFTIDVHNNGVSDADNVEPHRHGRPAAGRRLDRGRRLHAAPRRASRSTARSRTWPRARRSRSPSPTTSPRPPTATRASRNTRHAPPTRTRRRPSSDDVDIVENVRSRVTKTFDATRSRPAARRRRSRST